MLQGEIPYSLVLERASGTHNYSVQPAARAGPTDFHMLCSVPAFLKPILTNYNWLRQRR